MDETTYESGQNLKPDDIPVATPLFVDKLF